MKFITISREYGAGGGEVAARLAGALGWDLLDHELLHRAAQLEHLPDAELEALDEQAVSVADRFRLHPPHERYLHGLSEAARQAAAQGKAVLVGRGSHHLVGNAPGAFHLRLVAPRDWRSRRMAGIDGVPLERAEARCLQVDQARERFTRYFFGPTACQPWHYDLIVNTGRVSLDAVVDLVASLARGDLASGAAGVTGTRALTLSRELGAGETGFAPTLADRLGLRCYDRALLEQEAVRLGVLEIEVEKLDEHPAGIFERFRPGSLHRRYFEILGQLMNELAARGDALLVGRGGSCFLRDHPRAFHVPPGRVDAYPRGTRHGVSMAGRVSGPEADRRQRRPAPPLLPGLLRDGLVRSAGLSHHGQQRAAGCLGRGSRGDGSRSSLGAERPLLSEP